MRRRHFWLVCIGVAAAGLAGSESTPVNRLEPHVARCAGEISELHGVWRSRDVFLPAYGDMELVVYLSSLGARPAGVAVVPVYSPEPIYFRSHHVVFLSTGFILTAGSKAELTEAIRSARLEVQSPMLLACAAMAPSVATSLPDVRRRLAEQVAGYEDLTVRRLRRRDADPH